MGPTKAFCAARDVILESSKYSRICLIRHLKGLEKSDDLGEVTNYANR